MKERPPEAAGKIGHSEIEFHSAMITPAGKVRPNWRYPLLAAGIAALLPPLAWFVLSGGASLSHSEVWVVSLSIGTAVGVISWICHKQLCRQALGLPQDRFAAVPRLARMINSNLDLGEVFHGFIERLGRYLPIDRATVSLIEDGERDFRIFALSARLRTELEQGRYYPMERSRISWVLSHGRAEMSPDITSGGFWEWQALAEEGMRSAIDIPLREPTPESSEKEGRIFGVFSAYAFQPSAYSDQDAVFLATVGEHLAAAAANARLHEESKQRLRWLEMMHDLEDSLGRTLEVGEMLRIAADHAVKSMAADRILAILPEELNPVVNNTLTNGRYRLMGPGIRTDAAWRRLADFGPLVSTAVERKAPMLSRLVAEEAVAGTSLEALYYNEGIRSLAVMPILVGDYFLGVLLVGWRQEGAVSQENLQLLQDLALHLGVALRNAGFAATNKAENIARRP